MEESFEKLSLEEPHKLSYKTQKILFQHFSLEQRAEFRKVPETYKLQMETPYAVDSCTISQSANSIEFALENHFWKVTDGGEVIRGLTGNAATYETFKTELSKEEYMEKLVKMHLDREGIIINTLKIKNHPYGLEGIVPFAKIYNFEWHCDIVSDRYDYTTWFSCIRNQSLSKVDIQLNSSCHNQIFLEPVILGAKTLIVKCPEPLAPQTIENFHGLNLKLNFSSVTREFLDAFYGKWKNGWADGEGKLELVLADSEAKATMRSFLKDVFSAGELGEMEQGSYVCNHLAGGQVKFVFAAAEVENQ